MLTLSNALEDIISENPFLVFGLSNRLINLTKLAKFLKVQVEVRTKKEVTESAILMSLSRMQKNFQNVTESRGEYNIEKLDIQTGLSTYTFPKTLDAHKGIDKLYEHVQKKGGYITLVEGSLETTVIVDTDFANDVQKMISVEPKYMCNEIAAIGIIFDEKYAEIPGFLYAVMQQLLLQNINLIEIASTFTSFSLYIHQKEAKLAFETLFRMFNR